MPRLSALLFCSLLVPALLACSDDTSPPPADSGTLDSGALTDATTDAAVDESCEATFVWFQKDAYKETSGRGSTFWPPHTTTSLEVSCTPLGGSPEQVAATSRNNHGTAPEDVDPTGVMVLEAMRIESMVGTRAQMNELVAAFDACECGTTFLSMDELEDSVVEELVGELASYMTANLNCSGDGGTGAVVDALVVGDIEQVLLLGSACAWSAGSTWEEGFDEALTTVIAATSGVLADYHVCNNDAELQAQLWATFQSTGTAPACDGAATLCSSPKWFYTP